MRRARTFPFFSSGFSALTQPGLDTDTDPTVPYQGAVLFSEVAPVKEMENVPSSTEQTTESSETGTPEKAASTAAPVAQATGIDELDNIDFLLEEIENKIAPLALA
jgi:hypothetical protein